MFTGKKIIYIGAKPDLENKHAGGQSTASVGLIEYATQNFIDLSIIDSAQESFPPPTFIQRLFKAFSRVFQLVQLLIKEPICLLYTSPSPRDGLLSRMPSSA